MPSNCPLQRQILDDCPATADCPLQRQIPPNLLTSQMEDGVAGADVGQECVAESLAFSCSLHESRNVDDVEKSRNFAVIKRRHDVN